MTWSVDQLEGVAVAAADQHVHAGGLGLGGQRGDHVVGLEAVLLDGDDPQRVEHLLDERHLALELVGLVERLALYSAYSSERNVCRDTSKATARWVGVSSRSTLISIDVKP